MGSPPSDPLGPARPTPGYAALDRDYVPPALDPDVRRPPIVRHLVLFAATLVSTTFWGVGYYLGFAGGNAPVSLTSPALYVNGLWYSVAVLGILGAHEMGHYLACRYYGIDASLPYFLPSPFLGGTLGAFIRIRQPIPDKRQLFDIGIAGPIAGFVILLPALFIGLHMSGVVPSPTSGFGLTLGEPLLFQWASRLIFGALVDGYSLNIHPMVFAAWFGMLATALNLLPFGQLDGGHVTYSTLGRASTPISLATVTFTIAMTFVSRSWLVMTVMMVAMLLILGPRHPRVLYEHEPLGRGRRLVAVVAFIILALCFTPVPLAFAQ